MAKNPSTKAVLSLGVELDPKDLSVIEKSLGNQEATPAIKSLVESYLHEYSNGGVMLTSQDVARINSALGSPITGSDEVITAVEKSCSTHRGQATFTVSIDPVLISSLQDSANMRGITLEELVSEYWNYIHAEGWFMNMQPDVHFVPISLSDADQIRKMTGSNTIVSSDVMKLIKKAAA